jgi:thiol-disulfide isomerase/thioredoxin
MFLNADGRRLKTCNTCRSGRTKTNNKKLTINECREFAISKNGECLSDEYKNGRSKMRWRCSDNHEWEAIFNNIKKGHWCPHCAGLVKLTIDECREFAENKGGECLSDEYVNSYTKMKWKCSDNHEWEATFNNIKQGSSWCPYCDRKHNNDIQLCKDFAISKGGECLSDEYKNSSTKMRWRCSDNHEWDSNFNSIKTGGSWCPYCVGYKSEEMCRVIIEKYLLEKFPKKKPKFLEGLELDGYNEELNMAFEYNGRQHDGYIPYFHRDGVEDFERQIERDLKKYRICREMGVNLIIIPHQYEYKNPDELDAFIYNELCKIC